MNLPISRRNLAVTAASIVAGTSTSLSLADDEGRDYPAPDFKPKFKKPQLSKIMTQDFVIYAHFDLKMVKLLLDKEPKLINAAMDWGGGDWETGLGGASHLGNREIAEYLLEHGARIDIFAATMLGHLDVVKGLLTAHPDFLNTKGPHGIPLIAHAEMGKKQAEPVLKYLQSLVGDKPKP